jgi:membrane associated rhomboid family serine protease
MNLEKKKAFESLIFPCLFVLLLWLIKIYEFIFNLDLSVYGIQPRTYQGLIGILVSPLIHGSMSHLFSNTLPLLILGIIVFYFYRRIAFEVFFWIYIMTGSWVWVSAGSDSYHIGASGLVYGFASFLFFSGVFRKDTKSIALALLVTFVYGGLISGLLPYQPGVSWQSHLFGALSGAICSYIYRNSDAPSKYDQESDEDEKKGNFLKSV